MPETFAPKTWADGSGGGTPITAAELNRLETGVESMDDRSAALELGVATPVTITYASTITPDATAGRLFRCIATGDLTLADPTGGGNGQTIVVEILASGAGRVLTAAGTTTAIPAGQWWSGSLTYNSGAGSWLLDDTAGSGGGGGGGGSSTATQVLVDGNYVPVLSIGSGLPAIPTARIYLPTTTAALTGTSVLALSSTDFNRATGYLSLATANTISAVSACVVRTTGDVNFSGATSGTRTAALRVNGNAVRQAGRDGTNARQQVTADLVLSAGDAITLAATVTGSPTAIGGIGETGLTVTVIGT